MTYSTDKDIYKTVPRARKKYLKAKITYNGPIQAPIIKDAVVGKLSIYYKDELLEESDLLAFENIKRVNVIKWKTVHKF